jgi:tetratricopeptide (TPR) repeat protein
MIWLLALQLAMTPRQNYESAARDLSRMRFTEAEQEIDAALQQDPYFVSALILKAKIALFAQQPDIARQCLITAVVGNPSSVEAQLFLGVFYYSQSDFKLAIPSLQKAHDLSPQDATPVFYLALSYEALADPAEALSLYRQAENLSAPGTGETAKILSAYGRLLLSINKYQEGIEKEKLAIAIDSSSRDAHFELAKALDHERSYKEAAREGELALTCSGSGDSDAHIHLFLATVYRNLAEDDLARFHQARVPKVEQGAHP